jgi:hypothetical protein
MKLLLRFNLWLQNCFMDFPIPDGPLPTTSSRRFRYRGIAKSKLQHPTRLSSELEILTRRIFHKLKVQKDSEGPISIPRTSSGGHRLKHLLIQSILIHDDSPEMFSGQAVVVAGLGCTGADIACDLVGHASKIYLSHRRGNYVVSSRNSQILYFTP